MHQAAPITVRVQRLQGWLTLQSQCEGKAVSAQHVVAGGLSRERAWASSFLEAVCKAPEVLGVRQCTPYPVIYPKGGRV